MKNLMMVLGAIVFTVYLTSCEGEASICDCLKNSEKSDPDLDLAKKCLKAYGNLSAEELGEKMEECGLASESLDDDFEDDSDSYEDDSDSYEDDSDSYEDDSDSYEDDYEDY